MLDHAVITLAPIMTAFTVSNLTKYDLEISSRLLGHRVHIVITQRKHGAVVAPDSGIFIPAVGEIHYGEGM